MSLVLTIDKLLFSPLDKNHCLYFYYLSVFFFCLFVSLIFLLVFAYFHSKVKFPPAEVLWILINPLMLYFINRLYYSMCINSLKN